MAIRSKEELLSGNKNLDEISICRVFKAGMEGIPQNPLDRMPENYRNFSVTPWLWVKLFPPQRHVVPTPGTCDYDLI